MLSRRGDHRRGARAGRAAAGGGVTDAVPHPTPRSSGPGALLLIVLGGPAVALAGARSSIVVLPFVLVLTIMGGTDFRPGLAHLSLGRSWPSLPASIRSEPGLAGTDDLAERDGSCGCSASRSSPSSAFRHSGYRGRKWKRDWLNPSHEGVVFESILFADPPPGRGPRC